MLSLTVTLFSLSVFAGHPAMDGMSAEMEHPAQPLPKNALIPQITAEVIPDMMDGFNLDITVTNFELVIPRPAIVTSETVDKKEKMHGHMHLYINNEKKARLYRNAVHIPSAWLKRGINSITLSANNHAHGTYTHLEKDIQTTILLDTNSLTDEGLIKSNYVWPTHVTKK